KARELRKYADSLGIVCNQAHAPFPTVKPGDDEFNKYIFSKIVRAIEVASILGAKTIIVHPWNYYNAEQNAELYQQFLPYIKDLGMKIALENMWNWEKGAPYAKSAACSHHDDFLRHLSLLDDKYFTACLDLGHAEIKGLDTSAVEMINALKDRLTNLHIHDNDLCHDLHQLPYAGSIDFKKILDALKQNNYQGDITFEADRYIRKYPLELYPQATKLMVEIGKYFRSYLDD
ncbi:MAG TPA: sugar phosphate isomerase/epimerase family protein, partial [Clostridia bacterium]